MILEKIAASTRKRVEERKKEVPLEKMKAQAEAMEKNTGFPFYRALAQKDMSFICEVKKASPPRELLQKTSLIWKLPENMKGQELLQYPVLQSRSFSWERTSI